MRHNIILMASVILLLLGCNNSVNQIVNSETQSQLQIRSYQTKNYNNISKKQAIRGIISVLQDLGFVIDNADLLTGTVSGTKLDSYRIIMTVTIREKGESILVRANAQSGIKAITKPKIYQDFFIALDKSIFLEKNI